MRSSDSDTAGTRSRTRLNMTENPTLVCLGRDQNGQVCGRQALIHDIRYLYGSEPPKPGQPAIGAEYRLECPKCGMRTQLEPYPAS